MTAFAVNYQDRCSLSSSEFQGQDRKTPDGPTGEAGVTNPCAPTDADRNVLQEFSCQTKPWMYAPPNRRPAPKGCWPRCWPASYVSSGYRPTATSSTTSAPTP